MSEKKQLTFIAETKAVDVEQGIFEAMISTEVVDRDGDIMVATGARTENFMRNPVVLFGHDYRQRWRLSLAAGSSRNSSSPNGRRRPVRMKCGACGLPAS